MTSPVPAPTPRVVTGRLEWVDAGRGIAITLVALFHATNWLLGAGAHVNGWTQANLVMSSLRMPLFFTLSGLFAGKWVRGAWAPLWRTKLRLYVWVFLLWGGIGSFTYYLGVHMRGAGSLMSSIVMPYALSPFKPRLELWFIWALVLFFVVAKLTRKVPAGIQLAVAGVGAAIALSGWETASPGWNGAVKYYVFFLVGLYARDLVIRVGTTRLRGRLALAFVAWLVVAVGLWAFDLREVLGLYFVNCVLGVLGGIALSRALARWSTLRSLGSQTLPVYVAHTPIIIVFAVVLHYTGLLAFPFVDVVGPPLLALTAIALALALNHSALRHGAGWLYSPPEWFDVPRRRAAVGPVAPQTSTVASAAGEPRT